MTHPYIGLVRGVNIGGNNLVKMSDFRTFLTDLGFVDAKTLLQSGNFVFRTEGRSPAEIERLLEEEAAQRLGLRSTFFVRTLEEFDLAIAANPFPEEAKSDPSHLVIAFMKQVLDTEEVERIQAAVQGPEKMRAVGRELFVVFPEGIGTSKIDRTPGWNKLYAKGTARNWNTVQKLAALARG